MGKNCRHCKCRKVNRPRGLCWSCYYSPGVLNKYPSTSKFARLGIPDKNGEIPLPTVATEALPGTPEKVAELVRRAQQGVSLWHSRDERLSPSPPVEVRRCRVSLEFTIDDDDDDD